MTATDSERMVDIHTPDAQKSIPMRMHPHVVWTALAAWRGILVTVAMLVRVAW